MQDILDNANVIEQKDPFGALKVAGQEWRQLTIDHRVHGEASATQFAHIVVTGMGGSALAAGMAKDWLNLPIPFEVVKGYELPSYVNNQTLVIASSYSGNTEETVSAMHDALSRQATVAVIAAGGKLIEQAEADRLTFIQLEAGMQPRMAVYANLTALLTLFESYGVVKGKLAEVNDSAEWLMTESERWASDVPTEYNLAKQLASFSAGKTPIIYASAPMRSVAYKWKISFNENAKNTAFWNELPEFNHNEFIGWTSHPVEKPFAVFDLRSDFEHERIAKRFEVTDRLLSGLRPKAQVVELEGESVIREMLWGGVLADFVSIYLAILNGVDPTKVDLIEKFKTELG